MKAFKKSLCFFLALIMVFSALPLAFAEGSKETKGGALEITVKTNKSVYKTTSTAKITVTVCNKGDSPLYNVYSQAIFDDLSPVKEKTSITSKGADYLNPEDSFSYSYKAIINKDNFDIGFFSKAVFFFSGLINKPYFVDSVDLSGKNVTLKKYPTDISFGDFTAKNVIEVAFSTTEPSSDFTMPEEPAVTEAATTEATTAAPAVNVQINNNLQTPPPPTTRYNPPRTTRYTPPKTTRPRPTEPQTTRPKPTEPRTTEAPHTTTERGSIEARAYSAYISFLEANRGSIDKVDAAYLNNDGLLELIIQNINDKVAVYGYSDSYGVFELYSQSKGKGYNMDVYYDRDAGEILSPAADTGGKTYRIVRITNTGSTVLSELRQHNGKFEEGCYRDGEEISQEEFDRIVSSYQNKFIVEGSVSQLIPILRDEM